MKPSHLFLLLALVATPAIGQKKAAVYDSAYIFDAKRPGVLIGQKVILLEPNANNALLATMSIFTKKPEI